MILFGGLAARPFKQVPERKCPSGSAFQVTLKPPSGRLFPKCRVEDQFPWQVFPSVRRVAAVMLVEAMSQIMREARVCLSGIRDAAEEIDVIPYGPPSPDTGRLYNRT
jgi:hypothetical protein